jgi:hypothetical protein
MIEDYFDKIHNSESGAPYKYAESFNRYQIQLPLGITWPVTTGSLSSDNLYDDRTDNWLFYEAGLHKTAIYSDVSERFGGLTITVYSGSTNVYVQLSEYLADTNPVFISAPYTVSGENQNEDLLLASYSADTPENPEAYWISLPQPGTYKISFPFPVVANAITVTHSGADNYALSQILPRKTVQAFDLEVGSIKAYHVSASLIDTIALQVSDSIVVGPDLIGAKSIDGSKIIDGTISGVLIQNGTIIGNKILAGTISGVLISANTIKAENLDVDKLSAITANMGTLSVTEAITVTSGYMQAGITKLDNTGIAIGSLTTALAASDALRVYGSGTAGNIVGMAFYNGAYSALNPQITVQADSTNALEIENNALNGITNFNFPASGLDYSAAVNIYNGNLQLKRSPIPPEDDKTPGGLAGFDSDGTIRYELGPNQLLLNNNTQNTFVVDASSGDITTLGSIDVNAGKFKVTAGNGNVETHGNIHVGTGSHVFTVDGTTGNTEIAGTLSAYGDVGFGTYLDKLTVASATGNTVIAGTLTAVGNVAFGTYSDKFTVASTTGNTAIAGTLGVTGQTTLGALNATGAVTLSDNFRQYNYGGLYKNTAQTVAAGADAKITFQVSYTNGTIDNTANSRLTIVYAGFYVISAGVMGNVVNTWQVVTGGAFGSGIVLANVIQTDMRAYATKQVYLAAGTNLELWVRNSGASILTVTTGANGTVLSIAKVG